MSDEPQSHSLGWTLDLPSVEELVEDWKETLLGRIPRLRQVVIEVRFVDGPDRRVDVRIGREQHAPRQRVYLA